MSSLQLQHSSSWIQQLKSGIDLLNPPRWSPLAASTSLTAAVLDSISDLGITDRSVSPLTDNDSVVDTPQVTDVGSCVGTPRKQDL